MEFLSLIKLVDVLESPNKGEWYTIISQSLNTDINLKRMISKAESFNLNEPSPLIRYQIYVHPKVNLDFKKAKLLN